MRIDVITIFPELIENYTKVSILKKAQEKNLVKIKVHNLRWFALDRHQTVDDYPFGGGPGMVLKPEPIYRAVNFIRSYTRSAPRIILPSPQGKVFHQQKAQELAKENHLLFICGRYQGVDERILSLLKCEEISIGDYVLSGGELPTLVIIEAVVRLIPGVLGDRESIEYDSFTGGLLGPPQFTRPRVFQNLGVPQVLLSGNHQLIAKWRREKALEKTKKVRPELLNLVKKEKE